MNRFLALFLVFITLSCNKFDSDNTINPVSTKLYFPPINSTIWETSSPENLNWSTSNVNTLYNFLSTNNTRAFIILKDGKIVLEKYWGKNMVVIRFGESPDNSLVPVTFHNEMWNYINAVIN